MQLAIGLSLVASRATEIPVQSETSALLARMAVQPSLNRRSQIDALIAGLKQDSVWADLDFLHVLAAHDSQAALLNWKSPSFDATATATFAADRGYTGNGTSTFVDTNFNPATAGGQFAQNDMTFGIWCLTAALDTASAAGWFNGTNGITINPRSTSDTLSYRANQAAVTTSAGSANPNGIGQFTVVRTGASATAMFKNGSQFLAGAEASTALVSATLRYGSITAAGFSTRQIAAGFGGKALTPTKVAALYTRMAAYMTGVGAI
jgi:hypothetical protein